MEVPVMKVGVGKIRSSLEGWNMPTLFPDVLPGVSWLMLSPPSLLGEMLSSTGSIHGHQGGTQDAHCTSGGCLRALICQYLVSPRPFPICFCKFPGPSCHLGQREDPPFLSGIHIRAGR